ncbi:transcriptional regulator swi6 [Coccidioides posadasii str. Silveira]|uniref:Cell pattern formation-associated protein stuA n=3 Tax=Coccidioides posadasii TaxID=199306 RepID=E9D7U9_COCPS|nr:APSES domain containing protein [Coccidioides posadasii C735 delta SOWgp]EER25516.1 APSES domain containing protein [Coccidioides posadasii C735 delta SOWgp]EFW17458.1 start control protein cdc10 [Coccidioides posadasii str. Silveira]KMM70893.1 start control protein cdc10 [Coccidioides posadasii RMSCC 3488]QVM05467.1 transcriptional regulator swi6 [Coccidioides posadasii str. Silveira]|eukprot:XP_003067661.1 APSES domain containing protein [Coccidioides posadasii C735 delta SOWgp]
MSASQSSVAPPNGPPLSRSHRTSFSASQPPASGPAASPPPPASQQSNMSVSFSNGGGGGRLMESRSFGGYGDNSGHGFYNGNYRPQIYTAVYSNVSVYEMEVNGVAVMRRRSDSWLNATQILKVAGVVKARRTKTLEKEVVSGEHEKVQGGYGKYQGTWVSYQRGVELCRRYHVEDLLRPLLEYDMGQDGVSQAGQGAIDTPTKEQAMAAQRKRLYYGMDSQSSSSHGTFFQSISRTAASAVSAINKARFDSPASRGPDSRQPSAMRRSSQMSSQESHIPLGSQQSMYSVASDSGFASNMQPSQRSMVDHGEETQEPPRKRMRSCSSLQPRSFNASMNDPTPTEPSESFYEQIEAQTDGASDYAHGLKPLPAATTPERYQKMKLIMTLFLDKRAKDFSTHPAFLTLSSEDLEIPLDEYLNSALHWAAMLARMPLLHALVAKGVSIHRLNAAGETALQKAVGTRNNLDYRTFSKLLQVLAPTIEIIDHHGRTVLHHIAMMAATGGDGHVAAKHYLECLLEFIVRHGGPSNSQQSAVNGANNVLGPQSMEIIGLGRFMSDMVNIQDDKGDTALNLAGRARTILVPQLLEVGASPHIPNHTGLRPADYGVGVDMVNSGGQGQLNGDANDSFSNQLARTKKDILNSTIVQITSAIEESFSMVDKDLSDDLSQKQQEFDHWHAKIRESARLRQIEQNELDEIKRRARERVELQRQTRNLEQSADELAATLKEMQAVDASDGNAGGNSKRKAIFDADKFYALFPDTFDPSSELSDEQKSYLLEQPSPDQLQTLLEAYEEHNKNINEEIEVLKSKNVVLGEQYRRMVMACTGWSAEQVDAAAEGLMECVKDLNQDPMSEEMALEILMQDRGQDW